MTSQVPRLLKQITGLREGWQIVSGVNRANAGLCFDTWHYFRSYEDEATLSGIPGDKIFEVQLADATRRLRAPDMIEDLLRFRMLPGDGEFDIRRVTDQLKQLGAWQSVGPEVFADWIDPLEPRDVGQRCKNALNLFL
jgi:4-hydroxyphenylpyruvate dioxygenase